MGRLLRDRADGIVSGRQCRRLPLMAALLILSATASNTAIMDSRAAEPQKDLAPAKGTFLVASPRMADPRFSFSVILLLEHGEDGSLGLIINKDTKIPLSRVLPDLDVGGSDEHKLYLGGPVGRDLLIYLTRREEPPERSSHLMGNVYFGGDKVVLEQLLREKKDDNELRLFSGHSGWAPGQLASELARHDWKVLPADAYTVFEGDLDHLWLDLIKYLRPREDVVRGNSLPEHMGLQVSSYRLRNRDGSERESCRRPFDLVDAGDVAELVDPVSR